MRKPAKHQINPCPTCQGTGKVQGPKVAYLTPEDHKEYERLGRVWHKAWAWCGFVMFLLMPLSSLAVILTVPKEDGVMTIVVVMAIIFLTVLGIGEVLDRAAKSKNKILAEYGTSLGEHVIVQKEE